MVTMPGRGATVQAARGFYRDHLGIILVAQVIGLIAAVAFVLFAVGLQRQDWGRPLLRYAGVRWRPRRLSLLCRSYGCAWPRQRPRPRC